MIEYDLIWNEKVIMRQIIDPRIQGQIFFSFSAQFMLNITSATAAKELSAALGLSERTGVCCEIIRQLVR